jgi:hypothetical protein
MSDKAVEIVFALGIPFGRGEIAEVVNRVWRHTIR